MKFIKFFKWSLFALITLCVFSIPISIILDKNSEINDLESELFLKQEELDNLQEDFDDFKFEKELSEKKIKSLIDSLYTDLKIRNDFLDELDSKGIIIIER